MQCCLDSVQQKGEVTKEDVPRTFVTKERGSENVLDNSSHASTTKTIFFVCTKFAQIKDKTLCSLLVFTQLFRQEIKNAIFFAQFT